MKDGFGSSTQMRVDQAVAQRIFSTDSSATRGFTSAGDFRTFKKVLVGKYFVFTAALAVFGSVSAAWREFRNSVQQ